MSSVTDFPWEIANLEKQLAGGTDEYADALGNWAVGVIDTIVLKQMKIYDNPAIPEAIQDSIMLSRQELTGMADTVERKMQAITERLSMDRHRIAKLLGIDPQDPTEGGEK